MTRSKTVTRNSAVAVEGARGLIGLIFFADNSSELGDKHKTRFWLSIVFLSYHGKSNDLPNR